MATLLILPEFCETEQVHCMFCDATIWNLLSPLPESCEGGGIRPGRDADIMAVRIGSICDMPQLMYVAADFME